MQPAAPYTTSPQELPLDTRRKLSELFTRDEIRLLNERSNLMGFAAVGFTWGVIALTGCALVWASSQPLWLAIPVFIVSLVVLGGRHLALAILHHEAAHKSLFKTPRLNELVGDWLCARPTWNQLYKYREHHFIHHRRTNQSDDTDLSLIEPFPTSRRSLVRKLLRDTSGITGLKAIIGRVLMDAEVLRWTVANDVVWLRGSDRAWWSYPLAFFKNAAGALLCNAALYALCFALGHAWLYGMWVLSFLTPFPLFLRIRSLAEHACTDRSTDMFRNTRTTRAGWLARATVAPIRVNFHLEHHVMPAVPYFRLPRVHRMLRERSAVAEPIGYLEVLRLVSARGAPPETTLPAPPTPA